jgi:hypothetical protein
VVGFNTSSPLHNIEQHDDENERVRSDEREKEQRQKGKQGSAWFL